ncbi:MAG: hypothetical protein AAF560_09605 [Acidobacteriota bacterium]
MASASGDGEALSERLAALGLTRLRRYEDHPLATLAAVHQALLRWLDESQARMPRDVLQPEEGAHLLKSRAALVLGTRADDARLRIFATAPESDEDNLDAIRQLVAADVDGLVIDTRQGLPSDWIRLAELARLEAERRRGHLQVVADLAGPSIVTGDLAKGSAVLRWEPRRNQLGKLLSPARLWLTAEDQIEAPLQPVEAVLPVSTKFLRQVQTEDTVRFRDARGRRRELRIRGAGRSGCLAETDQTTYIEAGAELRLERRGKLVATGRVGDLPRQDRPVVLFSGNPLVVTRDPLPGRAAVREGGFLRSPARISCTVPEIFDQVQTGERVVFGDGTLSGVIESIRVEELRIRVVEAPVEGSSLQSGIAMRFPDSQLNLASPVSGSEAAVAFAASQADVAVLRGVERPQDVLALRDSLDAAGGGQVGIILGIESRRGVEALPRLLFDALRRPTVGLQISWGALCAEYGAASVGEVLAEVRWLACASHLPVILSASSLDLLARRETLHPNELQEALSEAKDAGVVIADGRYRTEVIRQLRELGAGFTPAVRRTHGLDRLSGCEPEIARASGLDSVG